MGLMAGNWGGLVKKAMFSLSIAGMGISAYLTYAHLKEVAPFCGDLSDCAAVSSSPYAEIAGIPVAFLGLIMYAVLAGLLFSQRSNSPKRAGLISLGIFAIALAGTLYSAYLTYVELFVLHALCLWCLTSAIIITVIFLLSLKGLPRQFW